MAQVLETDLYLVLGFGLLTKAILFLIAGF
jgi:hypothetical protein